MIKSGFKTDRGRQRDHNEDACLTMDEAHVYMVADGVGGNTAGELASSTAVSYVADFVRNNPLDEVVNVEELGKILHICLQGVNETIIKLTRDHPEFTGMATTLVLCYIRGKTAYFVNVGDSRAYIQRGSTLFQITEDHSYVNTLVKLGVITRDEARGHRKGNVITKAMGAGDQVEADFYQTGIEDGDILLLCTDGLYGELKEKYVSDMIRDNSDMQVLADLLVDKANEAGGKDNITAVCIDIESVTEGGNNE
ncbi:MAG: Stp1/IreP family PP2C-type Ser/Thr phosphatase [Anaerovoracaceae bacterium]|jgi:serine/threonine protein phosphatase PrpC